MGNRGKLVEIRGKMMRTEEKLVRDSREVDENRKNLHDFNGNQQ
jgi:hypothetical protein